MVIKCQQVRLMIRLAKLSNALYDLIWNGECGLGASCDNLAGPEVQEFAETLHVAVGANTYGSNCACYLSVGGTGFLVRLDIATKLYADMFGLVKLDARQDVSWDEVV